MSIYFSFRYFLHLVFAFFFKFLLVERRLHATKLLPFVPFHFAKQHTISKDLWFGPACNNQSQSRCLPKTSVNKGQISQVLKNWWGGCICNTL